MSKQIKINQFILLNGLCLAGLNIMAILAAFGVWKMTALKTAQIGVQAPLAMLFTILGWALWQIISQRIFAGKLPAANAKEKIMIAICAAIFAALLFYTLHYISQGYLAKFSNVLAIWAFQLPTNAVALILPYQRIFNALPFSKNRVS